MSLTNKKVFSNLKKSLSNVSEQFDESKVRVEDAADTGGGDVLLWDRLGAATAAIAKETNKLGIAFRAKPLPPSTDTLAMCGCLEAAVVNLLSTFLSVRRDVVSRHLVAEIKSACQEIVQALLSLAKNLERLASTEKRQSQEAGAAHLKLLGEVWEKTDFVKDKKISRSGAEACVKVMARERAMVQDAIEELKVALEASNDDGDDGGEALEDELGESWSKEERELLVPPGLGLLKVAQALFKKTISLAGASPPKQELDDVVDSLSLLPPAVDDCALSLYAPIDPEELSKNVGVLERRLHDSIELLGRSGLASEESLEAFVPFLLKAVAHNKHKIAERLLELGVSNVSLT